MSTKIDAPADDITLPDQIEVARQLWDVLREVEDRCDMELEDIGSSHVVWQLANVAIAAVRTQPAPASLVADILKDCCECERPNRWDVETVELRVSDLTMILERHIEGKE